MPLDYYRIERAPGKRIGALAGDDVERAWNEVHRDDPEKYLTVVELSGGGEYYVQPDWVSREEAVKMMKDIEKSWETGQNT